MRAAIFDPYLDTLGGGERYFLSIARVLADNNYKVDIEWKDKSISYEIVKRFGINVNNINFVDSVNRGSFYDLCFWLSDGSIPTLFARKNILHFQRPFFNTDGKSLINKMKLIRINTVIVNSNFTKSWIDKEFGITCKVIYPPVSIDKFKQR